MNNITFVAVKFDQDDSGRVYSQKTVIPYGSDGRVYGDLIKGSSFEMSLEQLRARHKRGCVKIVYEGPSISEARRTLGLEGERPKSPISLLGYAMSLAARQGREKIERKIVPKRLEDKAEVA